MSITKEPKKLLADAEQNMFAPMRLVDIELGQPLPELSTFDEQTGQRYSRALCLVRLHTRPLGQVELELGEEGLGVQDYIAQIWGQLATQINTHLVQDGLTPITSLGAHGLPIMHRPLCVEKRERFLVHAPFVSVIIPTSNHPDLLRSCLYSALALHYPDYEIIVVDNAPKNTVTADLLKEEFADTPHMVHYVREDRPGPAWARNKGIQVARGEILAFADDDVKIDPYWLAELTQAFRAAENVACVTGHVLPREMETPAQFWLEEYGGYSKGFARQIFDLHEHRPADFPLYPYAAGRFGAGANMAFDAGYLHAVGGFETRLENASDIESFFQVVIRGYRLVYEPGALVRHPHKRDYTGLRRQVYRYGMGMTAYLTKSVMQHPRALLDVATRIPYGLYFIFSTRSPKNSKKRMYYPRDLTRSELKGMLYGPFAYLSGHWL